MPRTTEGRPAVLESLSLRVWVQSHPVRLLPRLQALPKHSSRPLPASAEQAKLGEPCPIPASLLYGSHRQELPPRGESPLNKLANSTSTKYKYTKTKTKKKRPNGMVRQRGKQSTKTGELEFRIMIPVSSHHKNFRRFCGSEKILGI